jgi:hypothetical protein
MYNRILVAIDATPVKRTGPRKLRAEQMGRMTGATVYILHVARGHIIPGDITAALLACARPATMQERRPKCGAGARRPTVRRRYRGARRDRERDHA